MNDGGDPSEVFIGAAVHLFNRIAANYAHALQKPKIVSACGNSGRRTGLENTCKDMKTAAARFNRQTNTTGFAVQYRPVSEFVWYKVNGVNLTADDDPRMDATIGKGPYSGCGRHYNFEGDRIIMNDFLPYFHNLLGW